jgi:DNA invertase Pin-like site-specific DNA recombinase
MSKPKRVGVYARVSTSGQTVENQLRELQQVAGQRGWVIVDRYIDKGISGAKGRDQRPEFDRIARDAARGGLDLVAAWSLDRLGRSLHHVVTFMAELQEQGIGLYLHQQAVDSTTAAGKAMLAMCGVFAEFERSIIVDRINAGLSRARAQGKRLGRPPVSAATEAAIRRKRTAGMGIIKIAKELRIGVSVVQRVVSQ